MTSRKRVQIIKVKDYDDPAVNRLAVICLMLEQMNDGVIFDERQAALNYINHKYGKDSKP